VYVFGYIFDTVFVYTWEALKIKKSLMLFTYILNNIDKSTIEIVIKEIIGKNNFYQIE